jgi:hypothetical protein
VALVLVFLLALPAVTTRIYASDEVQYFAYLRSLWFDRDVSFENEYQHFYDTGVVRNALFHETFLERTTDTGLRLNFGTIGSALLWAPFYAVADVAVASGLAAPAARDGYSAPYIAAVCYGSACYGLLALLLSWGAATRVLAAAGLEPRRAGWSAWAIWLGTPLAFYMYVAPVYSHATSAFAVALFVWTWIRVRESWTTRGLIALGALAALMTMVREQDAFVVVGPAIDLAWTMIVERRWGLVARAAAGAAAGALTFVPQALAYLALNGRISPSAVTSRKMDWSSPHGLDVLISPEHGFFVWTPLAVLALAGLFLLLRRRASVRVALSLAAIAAFQAYVTGAVQSWTLAGAFGQRRFVALTVVLVIGFAAMLSVVRSRRATIAMAAVTGLCLWWNLGLVAQFGAGLMDRQRLEPAKNAYNTFITVPQRLPGLAWRYAFARQSFYKTPPADDRREPR